MGIGKIIARGAEKTGDFAHALGVGVKAEVIRLPDRVAVIPENTATLWRTTPSTNPPTPVQPAPNNPAPLPPLYPVKGMPDMLRVRYARALLIGTSLGLESSVWIHISLADS